MRSLVWDTETTGLTSNSLIKIDNQPRIVEFYGAVVDDQFEIVEELEFLCNPEIPIPFVTTKVHGITDQMVKYKPPFAERADEVVKLIESTDEAIAHNMYFDRFITETQIKRAGKSVIWPKRQICTVEATEWVKGYRLRLGDLHELLFGERFAGAHRAKTDVVPLIRCCKEMRKRGWI